MKLLLFLLFLFWLYNYWRFTGKKSYFKKMVVVLEHSYTKNENETSAIDLATAYMQVQRYEDAYKLYAKILTKYPNSLNAEDIKNNMVFCKKPLPWSSGLKNHNMGYWHNFMLVRFGGTRRIMLSSEAYFATDNYKIIGHV